MKNIYVILFSLLLLSCGGNTAEKKLIDANAQLEKDLEMYQNVWNTFLIDGDTSTVISDNFTFQIRRYPLDYEPFLDKDLSPKGFIELEPNTDFCEITSTTEENIQVSKVQIAPNPANALIQIDLRSTSNQRAVIYNMHGQVMERLNLQSGTQIIDITNLPPGTYWLKTEENDAQLFIKI